MNLDLDRRRWLHVKFGEVVLSVTDRVDDPRSAGVDRYVGLEHLDPGKATIARWGSPEEVSAQKLRFQPGDVIFGKRRAYQKKVARADFLGICSAHALVLRAQPEHILPEFLPVFLSSDYFLDRAISISVGSLSPTINWRDLRVQEFEIPPLDQQQRIADLFWAVETHLNAQRTLSVTATQIERRLVTGTLNLSGPILELREIGDVLMGRQRAPQYATGDNIVPYLRVANIGDNTLRLSDIKEMNFDLREVEQYQLRADDILVSEGQSRELVGQSARINEISDVVCFQNTLIRFRPDSSAIHPEYAFALIRALFYSGHFAALASQTTSIAHLGVKRFATCKVPVPPAEAQLRRIGQIQMTQDAAATATNVVNRAFLLRQSLLEEVFSS